MLWITATIYLLGITAFVAVWVRKTLPPLFLFPIALVCMVPAALFPNLQEGERFLLALLLGAGGYLAASLICRLSHLLQTGCLLVSAIAPWIPLIRLKKEAVPWEYCLLWTALFLCLLYEGASRVKQGKLSSVSEQYATGSRDVLLGLLPLASLPPALFLTLLPGELSLLQGGLYVGILFLLSVLLGLLQDQIRHRLRLQMLCRAFAQWQQESCDYMNTIRSQRHDFNLHLHAISGLVASGEYEQCGAYVQKLAAEAAAVNDIMPVADAVVGSMLYNMREAARKKGSDIYYQITYDMADTLCSGFECNKIIGNLLQNALDALTTPEALAYGIHAMIFKRKGCTVITVENLFNGDMGEITKAFEPGYSTKKQHEGIGLPMVLKTASHYGGRVYPEFEDGKIRFVVNLPNRISEKERTSL